MEHYDDDELLHTEQEACPELLVFKYKNMEIKGSCFSDRVIQMDNNKD